MPARFEDWDLWSPTLPETKWWWYRGVQDGIVSSPLRLCSPGSLGGGGQRWVRRADTAAKPTHQLLHVVGQGGHVALEVHLPQAAPPSTDPAKAVQGNEDLFGDGLPPAQFLTVLLSLVPLLGPQVLGIIHRQCEVPPFLLCRPAGVLDGTGLTVLLARHIATYW